MKRLLVYYSMKRLLGVTAELLLYFTKRAALILKVYDFVIK